MSLLMFTRTEKDMLGNRENVYLKICNSLSINLIMSTKLILNKPLYTPIAYNHMVVKLNTVKLKIFMSSSNIKGRMKPY